MEKKFHGKCTAFGAQRTILTNLTSKSQMKNKLKGPRTHTLTAVLDAILEDLVFSCDIVAQENIDPWRTGHRLAIKGSFKQSTVEPCGA